MGWLDAYPTAAWCCLVHSAYVPIKSLMDTSILGTAQRINMPCQDAYLASPAELPGASPTAAARLQCTAEHLVARREGGRDIASNVVAACAHCNHTRHKRKRPPDPAAYRSEIRRRVGCGKWHPAWVSTLGLFRSARGREAAAASARGYQHHVVPGLAAHSAAVVGLPT